MSARQYHVPNRARVVAKGAWLTVEADNKEEARLVVPPQFRSQAKGVGLNKFTLEQIEAL